ncbi:long-chain acyl-CoA synthetase [Bacillus mesophilus]|uniref:AMP-binding protein n=1 Tax=Bacillus mesophilus TaxID=1808955 RepID=A0A6M0Q6U2_9BACI|nr:AMP-binding protein [Bacillus mesophilus]MBM7661403.1 long-chain acyl-CoA synthetase [Bacillus mesophilus]NEY72076.1 AMP-binding protein [Bacillus mesophilus]
MIIGQPLLTYKDSQPNKPAIITNSRIVTYQDMTIHIASIQSYLMSKLGTGSEIRIALKLGNEPAFLETYFAAILLGYQVIPIDPKWTKAELEHVLDSSRPNLIVNSHVYQEIISHPSTSIEAIATPLDIFYIGFTSGSTGTPKGFKRHHQSWTDSFAGCTEAFELNSHDIYSAPGPLCHSLSLFAATYAIHTGATLLLSEKFQVLELLQSLVTERVTVLFVVPTMLQAMINELETRQIPSVTRILSSGAKWNLSTKDSIRELFPYAERIEYYGASETSFITYLNEAGYLVKPQSVGKAFPGVEVIVRNKDGKEANVNEVGLLYIRSTMIFSGYLHDEEQPALNEITVGDLAYIDEEGYITLVGREKNMIISGGLNIYPEEIELHLKKLQSIEEVVVTGIEDDYWGEKVVAFIKWKHNQNINEENLKKHCLTGLAAFKCPKAFYEIKDVPLTSSGKVDRKKLFNNILELRK